MLDYVTREEHRRIAAQDYVRDFVNVPKFVEFCRECGSHNQTWACPEFDFDPLDVWQKYRWLHLSARIMEFTPGQPRTGIPHQQLLDDVRAMFSKEKWHAYRQLVALHRRVPGSVGLSVGSCEVCTECTRPQGLPCRNPDQLFHSIESMGGDVMGTMSTIFGHPTLWSDGTTLPASYLVVTGLLCNVEELPERALAR
ncbi:DUF2284 domain-containing protein [Propionibacterium sp.]|uniref:DUF2284 domain-containing protein n=1 Tax=Propionibacterium sp. TaxID=1977903 RepID=UPI0039E84071